MRSWGVRLAVREGVEEREKGQGRRCRGTRGRGERKVVSELEDGCCGVQGVCVSGYAACAEWLRARSLLWEASLPFSRNLCAESELAGCWLAGQLPLAEASTLNSHHSPLEPDTIPAPVLPVRCPVLLLPNKPRDLARVLPEEPACNEHLLSSALWPRPSRAEHVSSCTATPLHYQMHVSIVVSDHPTCLFTRPPPRTGSSPHVQ